MDRIIRVRENKNQATGDLESRDFLYEIDGGHQFEVQILASDAASIEDAQTAANSQASVIKANISAANAYPIVERTDVAGVVTL